MSMPMAMHRPMLRPSPSADGTIGRSLLGGNILDFQGAVLVPDAVVWGVNVLGVDFIFLAVSPLEPHPV